MTQYGQRDDLPQTPADGYPSPTPLPSHDPSASLDPVASPHFPDSSAYPRSESPSQPYLAPQPRSQSEPRFESRPAPQSDEDPFPTRAKTHAVRRGRSQPIRWLTFIASVVVLTFVTFAILPHFVPAVNALISGGATPQGSLTIGLQDAPSTLDIRTRSNRAADRLLVPNVYEGLTGRDSHNKVVPALASSWKVSKDGLTYTFSLRTASFSDGSAFTSADVVTSFRGVTDHNLPGQSIFEPIKSVDALDNHTLRLRLSHTAPQLLWDLSTPAAIIAKNGDNPHAFVGNNLPAGTGPYTATGFATTPKQSGSAAGSSAASSPSPIAHLTLHANTRWWGGLGAPTARPATISVNWFDSSAHLGQAIRSGAVEAGIDIGPEGVAKFSSDKNTHVAGQSTAHLLVTFNSGPDSLLSDRIIREAHTRVLAPAIIKNAYGKYASENPWPIASLDPGYLKSDNHTGDFNPQKYTWLASAYSRQVRMAVSPEVPQKVVDAVTKAELNAGFSFTATRLTADQWHKQVTSRSASKPLSYDMALWVMHGSHTLGQWMTGSNWWDFDSPTADQQYKKALKAANEKDMARGLQKAAGTLLDGHPAAWLLQLQTVSAWTTSAALTGVPTAMTDISIPLASIRLP